MIALTKVFRFECAHAILGYPGACANIHGHSYELHVSVTGVSLGDHFIEGMGIIMDFKELKAIVQQHVISALDHQLVLSKAFAAATSTLPAKGLLFFENEPTAENLLIFIQKQISDKLPAGIRLASLKLWETRDSYAEWSAS